MARQPAKPATGEPVITDETRKVSELTVDPRNARRHSEAQISQIVTSIERFGFVDKIIIRPDGQVIGGHARLEALKRMGRDTADCRVVAGLSDSGYKAMGIALNKLPEASRWDDDILREVLSELQDEGENALSLGFTPGELKHIFSEPDDLDIREVDTGAVEDEFWISVRGDLKFQAEALSLLKKLESQCPGVTVELGTINVG